jgi:hypothetical protein
MNRTFLPSARAINALLIIGFCMLGWAFYMRYLVIEKHEVGLACEAGLRSLQCTSRAVTLALFNKDVFGWTALCFAVLNFVRPGVTLFGIALAFCCLGVVLHNAGLAGVAAGLLVLSLARPAIEAV